MKRCLLLLCCALFAASVFAKRPVRPKLVVGIVVDQMRWDYLYRYYDHYGADGFKRLMRDGFRCEQAFINYLPAFTAPGHSCIYTGSVPAYHGIAGNDWYEHGRFVYCTDDTTVRPVGGSMKWGRMSPRNLLATTIGDELRLATNGRSRVFGISLKDRSSILPAGHAATGAYWFDDSTGNFSTSTYYPRGKARIIVDGKEMFLLPEWVADFNANRYADTILSKGWALRDDSESYTQSSPHNPRYEGTFSKSDGGSGFPYRAEFLTGKGDTKYNNVRSLPGGNWLTLAFAKACVRANNLGGHEDPDMLCVSLSSTDYAGHKFGPNSMALEDIYVRLDAELARFLRFLDNSVGEGNYTVFLTADHGAAHNSLFLADQQIPAGNVLSSAMLKELNDYLKKELNVESAVLSLENYQVYFNPVAEAKQGPATSIKSAAIDWLKNRPEVAYVMDMEEPRTDAYFPEPVRTMAINGYYAPRSGKLQIILKPGYYAGYASTGTTHGTWNPYDTHIPLLWYGWGIPKGKTNREVHMTDIAPTLSALLHIQMPNGCVGKVITGITD